MPTCSKPSSTTNSRADRLLVVVDDDGEIERQGRGVFDLAHGKGGADIGQVNLADELLVEGVIGVDVGHHHAHQVIDVAAHAVELDDLGKLVDDAGKLAHPGFVMFVGLDRDEDGDADIDLDRVEHGNAALDD